MIRVNLLAAERPTKASRKAAAPSAPGAFQAYLFLTLFGGGALVLCAALWWFKTASIKELDTKIASAQARQKELQAIKAKVDEYERQKRMLDAKIQLIERLQEQQSGPVHLMDEVSKALPEFVWLTAMDQAGNVIRFRGESNGLTSVADFITNLQHAGAPQCAEPGNMDKSQCYFPRVDLQTSTQGANNVISFEISADYQNAFNRMKAVAAGAPAPGVSPPATGAKP
jgi:type IV pilus assembly protein PilN